MCPAGDERLPDDESPAEAPGPAADTAEPNDGLANFALGEVQRQAAERGEEVTEVDVSFVQRALAESQRMRREKANSDAKRSALWEGIETRQGLDVVHGLQDAMREHRGEVNEYMAAAAQQQQLEHQQELFEESNPNSVS